MALPLNGGASPPFRHISFIINPHLDTSLPIAAVAAGGIRLPAKMTGVLEGLSHDLTAIGGGFMWPRLRFASDDAPIQVSSRAVRNAPWEPVRHLNDIWAKTVAARAT